MRLADGELLIVATDHFLDEPIAYYGKRWEIETLFSCLKSKGFNFEDTHNTKPERIEKLLALLTIAFSWAYKTGEWKHEKKPLRIKNMAEKPSAILDMAWMCCEILLSMAHNRQVSFWAT